VTTVPFNVWDGDHVNHEFGGGLAAVQPDSFVIKSQFDTGLGGKQNLIGPFTLGSVIISAGGSTLTEDNGHCYYDVVNHRLLLSKPGYSPAAGAPLTITGLDASSIAILLDASGAAQFIHKTGGILSVGTRDANLIRLITNNATRVEVASAGDVTISDLAGTGTVGVEVNADGKLLRGSAPSRLVMSIPLVYRGDLQATSTLTNGFFVAPATADATFPVEGLDSQPGFTVPFACTWAITTVRAGHNFGPTIRLWGHKNLTGSVPASTFQFAIVENGFSGGFVYSGNLGTLSPLSAGDSVHFSALCDEAPSSVNNVDLTFVVNLYTVEP